MRDSDATLPVRLLVGAGSCFRGPQRSVSLLTPAEHAGVSK
jgi:hypothetical protein